jgi:hypothetical protein
LLLLEWQKRLVMQLLQREMMQAQVLTTEQ